jgi:hypothetical protein
MIDPTFTDITDSEVATISPYPPTMEELERNIAQLKNDLEIAESRRSTYANMYANLQEKVDALESWIKDQNAYLDEEIIQSLVDIFGLEITQEYDVQITVTFTGTVEAPLSFDMDNLENELEANLVVSYYNNDIQADFMEDRMEIDWSEN